MQKKRGPYRNAPLKGELRGKFTAYICKTCGREFRRRPFGHSSREYCTYTCEPAFLMRRQKEHEECLASLCKAMLVCSDVAFFETLHSYQQKRNAEHWHYVQENLLHYTVYSLPNIEFTEKQQRQQTIMAYLSALAMGSESQSK